MRYTVPMIQAIIFDFDGTILETEVPDYLAWQACYQEYSCELPLDLWLRGVGGSAADFDPYAYLEQQLGCEIDRAALRIKRNDRVRALITEKNIRPGVRQLLADAEERGLRLGIASSGGRDWIEGYLGAFALRQHFEVIFTRDDVERVKPDPTLYRLAVSALGVTPAQAVAIEDSRNGMLAAKAAGLRCVVVPGEMTKQLNFAEADLRMESLTDRPLAAWLAEVQKDYQSAD